jgi:cell division protein FtsW
MLRPGHAVAICVLALLMIGVVMVNSAGMTIHTREPFTIEAILLSKTTLYAGLAMAALIACALLPIRRLLPARAAAEASLLEAPMEPAIDEPLLSPAWFRALLREYVNLWPLWAGAIGLIVLLATVYIPGIRSPKNGSHRWINLHLPGLESVQPSELAKWGLVLLIAIYAACSIRRMRSFWLGLVPGLIAAGLVAGFVVIEDLGTGALMAVAAGIVLIAAGARIWHLLILCPVPLAGAVLAIVTNPYRMHRIESFMNPFLDPQGKGFHMIQSMSAISGGSIFGRGLGNSLQKFGYLPEDTTDFIFAIICDELGVAGAAIVLFLMGALVWAVWGIVRRENTAVLKLIGLGVMATVGVQAAINLAVVTGLGPTKGIALPLISSGGTGWILTAAALGLVVAMDRAQHADLRQQARLAGEPESEPEGYAMPTLGAVAMSAAAATATMAEIKPQPAPEPMVAMAEQESADEEMVAADDEASDDAIENVAADEVIAEEVAADDAAADVDVEDFAAEVVAEQTSPVAEAAAVEEPTAQAVDEVPTIDEPALTIESTTPVLEESVEDMFAGAVIAEPPPVRDLPPVVAEEPALGAAADAAPATIIEPKSEPKVFPGLPGQTGLLFDPDAPASPTPEIIVTERAKNWLKTSGEESAA